MPLAGSPLIGRAHAVQTAAGGCSVPLPKHARLLEGITAVHRGDPGSAWRCLEGISSGDPVPSALAPLWLRFQADPSTARVFPNDLACAPSCRQQ